MFRGSGIEPKTDQKSTAVITLDIAPTLLGDFGCGTQSHSKLEKGIRNFFWRNFIMQCLKSLEI